MNAFEIILLIIGALALSTGICFAEYYATARKNVFFGLIPTAAIWALDLIILLIMAAAGARASTAFTVFYILQLPVVVGVVSFVVFRRKRRAGAIAEQQKEIRLQTARRMEEEKRNRLLETLKGFVCAESKMKPEGQREIVVLSKTGKNVSEICDLTGADRAEVELILASYDRYDARINSEYGTSDLIFTPEQEESIVTNVINSLPFDHSISSELWTKKCVRSLAADIVDKPVSIRMISAYMKHWGFTVPAHQTIKFRSERPAVRTWLAGEFEDIRKRAADEGGEILWIYTVPLDSMREISTYMPKNPVMISAVSNDGSMCFKVYDASQKNAFDDFYGALSDSFKTKIFAVVNENYDEYVKVVGKEKLKLLSDRIELFKCV